MYQYLLLCALLLLGCTNHNPSTTALGIHNADTLSTPETATTAIIGDSALYYNTLRSIYAKYLPQFEEFLICGVTDSLDATSDDSGIVQHHDIKEVITLLFLTGHSQFSVHSDAPYLIPRASIPLRVVYTQDGSITVHDLRICRQYDLCTQQGMSVGTLNILPVEIERTSTHNGFRIVCQLSIAIEGRITHLGTTTLTHNNDVMEEMRKFRGYVESIHGIMPVYPFFVFKMNSTMHPVGDYYTDIRFDSR